MQDCFCPRCMSRSSLSFPDFSDFFFPKEENSTVSWFFFCPLRWWIYFLFRRKNEKRRENQEEKKKSSSVDNGGPSWGLSLNQFDRCQPLLLLHAHIRYPAPGWCCMPCGIRTLLVALGGIPGMFLWNQRCLLRVLWTISRRRTVKYTNSRGFFPADPQ